MTNENLLFEEKQYTNFGAEEFMAKQLFKHLTVLWQKKTKLNLYFS